LREEGADKPLATLATGDWFGDLLEISGQFKAVASSKEVVVVRWDAALWTEASCLEIEKFWTQRDRASNLKPPMLPQTVGYPFVSSLNTAAACLTMVAQHLQNSAH